MGNPIPTTVGFTTFNLNPFFTIDKTTGWSYTFGWTWEAGIITITDMSGTVFSDDFLWPTGTAVKMKLVVSSEVGMNANIIMENGPTRFNITSAGTFTTTGVLSAPGGSIRVNVIIAGSGHASITEFHAQFKAPWDETAKLIAFDYGFTPVDRMKYWHYYIGGGKEVVRLARRKGSFNCLVKYDPP